MQAISIDDHNALLVLNPKTATSSMRQALFPGMTNGSEWDYVTDCRAHLWPGWFRFAFVRNPWDRLVSAWMSKIASRDEVFRGFKRYGWKTDTPFSKFARDVCEMPVEAHNGHFREQLSLLCQGGELCVDFIGRFENLTDDWAKIQAIIPVGDLGRVGTSHHAHYTTYYTPKLRDKVRRLYEQDIETFGYAFGDRDDEPVQSDLSDVRKPGVDPSEDGHVAGVV